MPGIQPSDLQQVGVTLKDCHVIMYAADVELLREALHAMACRDRPKVAHEQQMGRRRRQDAEEAFEVVCSLKTYSSFGPNSGF